jgi:diguanylate cyclase (GGDEF)-like protein
MTKKIPDNPKKKPQYPDLIDPNPVSNTHRNINQNNFNLAPGMQHNTPAPQSQSAIYLQDDTDQITDNDLLPVVHSETSNSHIGDDLQDPSLVVADFDHHQPPNHHSQVASAIFIHQANCQVSGNSDDQSAYNSSEDTLIIKKPKISLDKTTPDRPVLLVMTGNMTGYSIKIEAERTLIGRSPDCDISLYEIDLSRKHAEIIYQKNNSIQIIDLNSVNGTYVNGKKIQRCELEDGDHIRFGTNTIIKFSMHSELDELFHRRLYENSILDGLTQIYNRKFFEERLSHEFSFAMRHNTPLSLLMLDIDHFKPINDNYGHPTGDHVLRIVAQTIDHLLRKEDTLARYGGEEFAVIARNIMPTQAAILGERIRSTIEHLIITTLSGVQVQITISVGVATMHKLEPYQSHHNLLQEADSRLYLAKQRGRNQVIAEK